VKQRKKRSLLILMLECWRRYRKPVPFFATLLPSQGHGRHTMRVYKHARGELRMRVTRVELYVAAEFTVPDLTLVPD